MLSGQIEMSQEMFMPLQICCVIGAATKQQAIYMGSGIQHLTHFAPHG